MKTMSLFDKQHLMIPVLSIQQLGHYGESAKKMGLVLSSPGAADS